MEGKVERILVVRLGAMGDILHTLPAVSALRHRWPAARLTWAVEPKWTPLLAGNPAVDELVKIDRHTFAGLRSAWQQLRQQSFDMAIDFQGLLKSSVWPLIARVPHRVGTIAAQAREPLAARFYTDAMEVTGEHMVDRHLSLVATLGAKQRTDTVPLPPGVEDRELPPGPFILASPDAGWGYKQWPRERFLALARKLREERGWPLVLSVAPGTDTPGSENVIWQRSGLPGLIGATRRATAVIGVDSGPMHLAAALKKPGVALFGPTDPARNGPYGGSLTVLRKPGVETTYKRFPHTADSMLALSVEEVWSALQPALQRACR